MNINRLAWFHPLAFGGAFFYFLWLAVEDQGGLALPLAIIFGIAAVVLAAIAAHMNGLIQ